MIENMISYGFRADRANLFLDKFGETVCRQYLIEYTNYVSNAMEKSRRGLVYGIDDFFVKKQVT